MALSFPLSFDDFMALIGLEEGTFTPSRNDQISGLVSGQPLHAELASPLWRFEGSTGPIPNDDAEAIAALLEVLEHPGRDFYIANPRKKWPRADPDGKIIGGAAYLHTSMAWDDDLIWNDAMPWGGPAPTYQPALHTLASNNRQISVDGLPPAYVISRGDMLHFEYGPEGQKRRALHRAVETVTASADGLTPLFEVFPHIRSGALAGDPVSVVQPTMRAKIVPGSYQPEGVGAMHQRFTFSAIQKLI